MMDFSSNSRSSSISDLSVDFPNNPNDDFIDETEVDMDVDGVVDISERSFPEVSSEYCEKFVGIVVTDSDSDHEWDVASLSSFSESECDSIALTSEIQEVPEENDEFVEDNFAEVDLDDELANGLEEYEELEENQDELANPVENEDQIDVLANNLEEEQIVENLFEVASNHSVLEGSDNDLDSVTDLLASPFKYSSEEKVWIESSEDDDAEFVEDNFAEVDLDDELANGLEEYEELEENQDELTNPVENEDQIDELASTLEEEQIVENLFEVASNHSVLEGSDNGHDSVTYFKYSSEEKVWVEASDDDDDSEFMVEDADEVIYVDTFRYSTENEGWIEASDDEDAEDIVEDVDEVILVDDDEIMVDLEASELSGNREQFLQSVPVATAASDSAPSLTPSEEASFRIFIERTRLYEMEREAADLQARVDEQEIAAELLDEEVAAGQHTGYGNFEGNLDFEGVLPKLPLFSLISNWLSHTENNFNLFV